jgi:hypothetical protein
MPNDPVMRPTSDDEARERSPSQDTRAAWERPALIRLATSEASMPRGGRGPGEDRDHQS